LILKIFCNVLAQQSVVLIELCVDDADNADIMEEDLPDVAPKSKDENDKILEAILLSSASEATSDEGKHELLKPHISK
jgi:hypothetical protein